MANVTVPNDYKVKGNHVILHTKGKHEGYLCISRRQYNKISGMNWYIVKKNGKPYLCTSVGERVKPCISEILELTPNVYEHLSDGTFIFDYTGQKVDMDFSNYKLIIKVSEAFLMKRLEDLLLA